MPSLIPLDNFTGAAFLGFVFSVVIYGITCLQAYLYYSEYSGRDSKFLKSFVAFLVLLDTFHVALVAHLLYWYMVTNFGDYEALTKIVWSLEVQVIVGDLVAFSVQCFFAWRVYLLSGRKNLWIPVIILIFGLGLVVSGIGFMITGFQNRLFSETRDNIPWTVGGLSSELVADTVITSSMIYYLSRGRTPFNRTHQLINSLIMYALNTSLLTTIFTVLTLAFFVRFNKAMLFTPFFFVLARVYSCSFLSTLNTRQSLRQGSASAAQESLAFSEFPAESRRNYGPGVISLRTGTEETFAENIHVDSKFVATKV